jgi:hypothetical protein
MACGIVFSLQGAIVQQTLFLNRGVFTTVDTTTFPALAFNATPVYNSLNKVVFTSASDIVVFTVINNDTVTHGFAVKDYAGINSTIAPGDTITDTLAPSGERIYIYYDNYNYPDNRYLGAAGMICVSNATANCYFWNIKEHQMAYNDSVSIGSAVNWNTYYPDYFTINGKSFPDLQVDTTAVINAQLGDTVRIFIVNTGQSLHSLHFHGFHQTALFSTSTSIQQGSIKETWPMRSMEGIVLEFVPDKVGRYSVHDHNLAAVTGGNTHPNGMFIIMEIQ